MNIQIRENAGDLRVEIYGRFAGNAVEEVSKLWAAILQEQGRRQFTVDITNMTDYDHIGCSLLRKMRKHGVQIAAASAGSLEFLAEISAPHRPRPALVQSKPVQSKPLNKSSAERPRFAASGE
jgi:hypothetical protein